MKTEIRAPGMTPGNHAAILDGRKTQTRRVMKPQPTYTDGNLSVAEDGEIGISGGEAFRYYKTSTDGWYWQRIKHRYGPAGISWALREPLHRAPSGDARFLDGEYAVDRRVTHCVQHVGWTWLRDTQTSRYMPLCAARYFVKLTDIRIERVQDISEADAIAEGIEKRYGWGSTSMDNGAYYVTGNDKPFVTAVAAFESLWDSINGKTYPWENNCWVVAYTFGSLTLDPGREMP